MFIVVEGIDGSGKSSLCRSYVEALVEEGIEAISTCEPTHEGKYGAILREMLRGDAPMADVRQMVLLFALDRHDHLERVVLPALERGAVVVCDRYVLSNVAYQGAEGWEIDKLESWICDVNACAPLPDLSVYLAVRPEIARARIDARGGVFEVYDSPERAAFRARVVEIYERYHHDVWIDTSDLTKEQTLDRMLSETRFRRGKRTLTGQVARHGR